MSIFMAARFSAVSRRVSPFLKLLVAVEKFTMSADRRFSASSKLIRVRVLGSWKKLTTVRPRMMGTLRTGRSNTARNRAAMSRTPRISSADISSRPRTSLLLRIIPR